MYNVSFDCFWPAAEGGDAQAAPKAGPVPIPEKILALLRPRQRQIRNQHQINQCFPLKRLADEVQSARVFVVHDNVDP